VTDYLIVDGFDDWNTWYGKGEVRIEEVTDSTDFHDNQGVIIKGAGDDQLGIIRGDKIISASQYFPSGVSPRNVDQLFALHILRNSNIPLKILSGVAGSGKTLLACAHAMEQIKNGKISKIVIAKSMTPVGRDIGFLKGDMYDKVRPWLGPFYDNFVNCGIEPFAIDSMIEHEEIEIVPITFIQGRSLTNTIVIIDEAQNLDMSIIKQIITRAGDNSEIIMLGDQTQQFAHHGDKTIDVLIDRGRMSSLVASVHMNESLRSPLADWAVKNL
jgi:PhoH-like ATPase